MISKSILIGVSSSISIYKTCDLVRNLRKKQLSVTVIMTHNSQKFIQKLTFETLSENKVYTEEFHYSMPHLELKKDAALLAIVPASANIIGKCANGIADDLLSSTYLSIDCPVIIAPAMNPNMYKKKSLQRNIKKLIDDGVQVLSPQTGETVCGDVGVGKLADIDYIKDQILKIYYEI